MKCFGFLSLITIVSLTSGCSHTHDGSDGGLPDAGDLDSGSIADAGTPDSGTPDAGNKLLPDGGFSTAPGNVAWLMAPESIALIEDGGAQGFALAHEYFNQPAAFLQSKTALPSDYAAARWTRDFASFDGGNGFANALAGCALPSTVAAVELDIEQWPYSPLSEQQTPVQTYAAAHAAVLAYNQACRDGGVPLLFIATPAINLSLLLDGGSSDKYQSFLNLGLARQIAENADVFELQAQGLIDDPTAFTNFVQQGAAQAKAGNPNVEILAGLSSFEGIDAGTVYQEILQTFGTSVDGYWLNTPGQTFCDAGCAPVVPDVAIAILQLLLNHG